MPPLDANAPVRELLPHLTPYRHSQRWPALFQLLTTVALFGGLVTFAYSLYASSAWFALLMSPLIGLTWVRLFILKHDCGHGSFFTSQVANRWVGRALGVSLFTPFDDWAYNHRLHHATSGQLWSRGWDREIYTMTTQEYHASTPLVRWVYRLWRSRFLLCVVFAPWIFILRQRFPGSPGSPLNARRSVWGTNLALAVIAALIYMFLDPARALLVIGPSFACAATAGVWLFYVQHQFEGAYWEDKASWDYAQAALKGSSRLVLPRVFRWFSADIGLHHIHHLDPRIPNYRLEDCDNAFPELRVGQTMSLLQALRAPSASLWDAQRHRLISFQEAGAFSDEAHSPTAEA